MASKTVLSWQPVIPLTKMFSITLFSSTFREKSPDLELFSWISGKFLIADSPPSPPSRTPMPDQIGYQAHRIVEQSEFVVFLLLRAKRAATYFRCRAPCGLTRKCQETFGCVWMVHIYVLDFQPRIHVSWLAVLHVVNIHSETYEEWQLRKTYDVVTVRTMKQRLAFMWFSSRHV